jgi:hypothetical protein
MGVDWEERINFDRLRRERLQKAKDAMEKSDVEVLFIKIASENAVLWTGMKDASAESRKMCYMKLHDYPKSCSRCL